MVVVKKYHLPPTDLIPNSPHPVLHYPAILLPPADLTPAKVHDLFTTNGWEPQWIYRYGPTQPAHYHTRAHEAMAVLSGTATIRLGVADTDTDPEQNTHGLAREEGGVEVLAQAGDVFVLPAGTAHKTFDVKPEGEFALLTPGDGHGVAAEKDKGGSHDVRAVLDGVRLAGFTMLGAYPVGGEGWDFAVGGEKGRGEYEMVWAVPKPARDPVLGTAEEGLCGQWK
ncbi:hypothetical protein M406DRAFT_251333 [Cryphonectria parasitica EP155]|uniref:Cupin type-1 domain-containing protein n=1 Tax=Cryphonectria parasitica (strain ATCC 38755 / EP155) TaxID=660469 RepID=A0A9P4Y976_CRYP1|nr:uncharacterized protein M406DRAFT_251333 [Cryphonectria parasitica EP155]KAF3769123.1 hypothetical protein M406DRAFT_251333 [Cryphonectria parasitica EP155]